MTKQPDKEVNMLKKPDNNPMSVEARVKRIETMVYLLCMHLGLDPRTGERIGDSHEDHTHG